MIKKLKEYDRKKLLNYEVELEVNLREFLIVILFFKEMFSEFNVVFYNCDIFLFYIENIIDVGVFNLYESVSDLYEKGRTEVFLVGFYGKLFLKVIYFILNDVK